jgi:hypothetical protein
MTRLGSKAALILLAVLPALGTVAEAAVLRFEFTALVRTLQMQTPTGGWTGETDPGFTPLTFQTTITVDDPPAESGHIDIPLVRGFGRTSWSIWRPISHSGDPITDALKAVNDLPGPFVDDEAQVHFRETFIANADLSGGSFLPTLQGLITQVAERTVGTTYDEFFYRMQFDLQGAGTLGVTLADLVQYLTEEQGEGTWYAYSERSTRTGSGADRRFEGAGVEYTGTLRFLGVDPAMTEVPAPATLFLVAPAILGLIAARGARRATRAAKE